MPTCEWEEYSHRYELPVGLVHISGHYKKDENTLFSSLFYVDNAANIYAIDPKFYDVTEPEDVIFTHFVEADADPFPTDAPEEFIPWSYELQELLRSTNEFLMSVRDDGSNKDFTIATNLLEGLLTELGELGAY